MTRNRRLLGVALGFAALMVVLVGARLRPMNSPDLGRNYPQIQSHSLANIATGGKGEGKQEATIYLIRPADGSGTMDSGVRATSGVLGNANSLIFDWWTTSQTYASSLSVVRDLPPDSLAAFRSNVANFQLKKIRRWKFWSEVTNSQTLFQFTIYNDGKVTGPTQFYLLPYVVMDFAIEADSIVIKNNSASVYELTSLVW